MKTAENKEQAEGYAITPKELACLFALSCGLIPEMESQDFAQFYDTVFHSFWEDFMQRLAVHGFSFAFEEPPELDEEQLEMLEGIRQLSPSEIDHLIEICEDLESGRKTANEVRAEFGLPMVEEAEP